MLIGIKFKNIVFIEIKLFWLNRNNGENLFRKVNTLILYFKL